jgi:hypothetical protein
MELAGAEVLAQSDFQISFWDMFGMTAEKFPNQERTKTTDSHDPELDFLRSRLKRQIVMYCNPHYD